MEAIYYTLAGILLYFISDLILQKIELSAGRRFENRSLIFFFILSFLALTSFALLRHLVVNQ